MTTNELFLTLAWLITNGKKTTRAPLVVTQAVIVFFGAATEQPMHATLHI